MTKELTMSRDTNGVYQYVNIRNKADDVLTAIDAHYYQLRARAYYMMYQRFQEEGRLELALEAHRKAGERATVARDLLISLIP
jgi:hypothetical protein